MQCKGKLKNNLICMSIAWGGKTDWRESVKCLTVELYYSTKPKTSSSSSSSHYSCLCSKCMHYFIYLVHLTKEQILRIGEVPWMGFNEPLLINFSHVFPGIPRVGHQQLLPELNRFWQNNDSFHIHHYCGAEFQWWCWQSLQKHDRAVKPFPVYLSPSSISVSCWWCRRVRIRCVHVSL